jgi:chemotaxis protein CheD
VSEVYLYPGTVFAESGEHAVTTVLGSCIAVCLWDPLRRIGAMNHYLLPLWNGDGLPSPRYGNIAIGRLLEMMSTLGCAPRGLRAKVFGGGSVIQTSGGLWNIGERNALLAEDLLQAAEIPIVGRDIGGSAGRRIRFLTATGEVFLKRIRASHRQEGARTVGGKRGRNTTWA